MCSKCAIFVTNMFAKMNSLQGIRRYICTLSESYVLLRGNFALDHQQMVR